MNAPDAAARFGSGRAVPRIEDARAARRPGPLRRQPRRRRRRPSSPSSARPTRTRASSSIDADGGARDARRARRLHRRRARRRRRQADARPTPASSAPTASPPAPRAARAGARDRCASSARRSPPSSPSRARPARDAVEAIVVDYDELPAVVDVVAATAAGRAALVRRGARQHRRRDAPRRRRGDRGGVRARRARASRSTSSTSASRRRRWSRAASPPTVDAASGRLAVRISSQMPTGVAATHRRRAARPGARATCSVLVGDVGGGFGMKTGIYPEDIVVAHAARTLERAVRWQADRSEEFLSGVARPRRRRAAPSSRSMPTGKVLALRVALARQRRRLRDAGRRRHPAADRAVGLDQHLRHPRRSTCTCSAVLTNTAPTGPYRGAGRPEAIYIIERLIDAAAREMKLDPAELRRRNMIRPEQMPYKNADGPDLRQRRASSRSSTRGSRSPTGTASRRGAPRARRAASCAAAASPPSSSGPAATSSRRR